MQRNIAYYVTEICVGVRLGSSFITIYAAMRCHRSKLLGQHRQHDKHRMIASAMIFKPSNFPSVLTYAIVFTYLSLLI